MTSLLSIVLNICFFLMSVVIGVQQGHIKTLPGLGVLLFMILINFVLLWDVAKLP